MLVAQLLLEGLEELLDGDFQKFTWFLSMNVVEGCSAIPKSRLERASRPETVSRMIEAYGEESAVNVTVEILKRMNLNGEAEKLRSTHAEGKPAACTTQTSAQAPPPPAAAAATVSAQHGSVVFAPTLTGSRCGPWNITINKS